VTQPVLKVFVVSERVGLPAYATAAAAGMDLQADIAEPLRLDPGDRATVPTGIKVRIPDGYEGQIRPRSGLAHKHGIAIVNAPGTVDADYLGVVHAILVNLGREAFTINPGDRIAQMIISPVTRVQTVRVESDADLGETERGEGRFGSTGR
jgi:dUTP pyrophosphatase